MVFAECSPGYTGVECTITCLYPLFGENCQKICSCSPEEVCDFVSGCLKGKNMNDVRRLGWDGMDAVWSSWCVVHFYRVNKQDDNKQGS